MGATAVDYNDVPFGRGAFRMYGKLNDYQYYRFYDDRPKDGSAPDRNPWGYCVHQGVVTIQRLLLNIWGFEDQEVTGEYGRGTKRRIVEFQQAHKLSDEGITGPFTMKELMRPVVKDTAARIDIEPKYLHAFASLESGYDPGAQGIDHPTDLGLWQHNVQDTSVSDIQAWDYETAAEIAAKRFHASLEKYIGKGPALKLDCAIAQHNWPVGADLWFEREEAPTPEIQNYVDLVLSRAETWK